MDFVVARLGKDSVDDIVKLDAIVSGTELPITFSFSCAQVEEGIDVGWHVLFWLGSDNNKGIATSWKQGLRALGRISSLSRGGSFNDNNEFQFEVLAVFPHSIDQFDFLEKSALHYKYFSKYPVVGVRSSRNNAIQRVHHDDDRQSTAALLTAVTLLHPGVRDQIAANAPELLDMLSFVPASADLTALEQENSKLVDDDVWSWITDHVYSGNERNFLFLGPPGTGKTWHAQRMAHGFAGGEAQRVRFVQFHPSFSYDDFVEGYTPKLQSASASVAYEICRKHFMLLSELARKDSGNLYTLVIDELTRGEPARIFGELLTYIEVDHRNKPFSLAYSGETAVVPPNLVIIATANPYDRSVGELDDALIRRFRIREFPPDGKALHAHLDSRGLDEALRRRVLRVFDLLNNVFPHGFGHSHFWSVGTVESLRELWLSQLRFQVERTLLYDREQFVEIDAEVSSVIGLDGLGSAENVTPNDDQEASTS